MDRAARAAAQWRRERPEVDPSPMVPVGRLKEAAALIERLWFAPLFARYGLQSGEFDVLATLRRSGPPYALAPTALFEAMMVSSGGMTHRLDRLERAGWITRRPNPDDRRSALAQLTDSGRALIDAAVTAHVDNERTLLASLSAAEQAALSSLLEKLLIGLSVGPTA